MTLKAILLLLARRRERAAAKGQGHSRGDQFPVFTPRDWADLPVHHPVAER